MNIATYTLDGLYLVLCKITVFQHIHTHKNPETKHSLDILTNYTFINVITRRFVINMLLQTLQYLHGYLYT